MPFHGSGPVPALSGAASGSGIQRLLVGRWLVLAMLLTSWLLEPAGAQEAASSAPSATPVATESGSRPITPTAAEPGAARAASSSTLPKARVIYIKNDRGEVVPVRNDATLEEFIGWLEDKSKPLMTNRAMLSVASIDLDGHTDEQFAHLLATIRIEASNISEPLLFPLGLTEAVIEASTIKGPTPPMFVDKDPEKGYRWQIAASGSYEFQLKLLLPVRRISPWRRLQLTLPSAPVSRLQLTVPEAAPVLKVPEEVILETRFLNAASTQVRAAGFGSRMDVQWQPTSSATDQRTTLEVNTAMLVRGSSSGFLVEATQYVKSLQGVFREFTVRLPPKCDLLQVEGSDIRERRIDPEDPDRVTIELQNPTSGNVVVKWSVRLHQSSNQRTLLQGFQVDSARRQSGEIGLMSAEGARWAISEANDPHLERMNAGELRNSIGGSGVVRAYRFFDQPFRLPLELQKVDPFFDVRPLIVLYATRDELRLEGRYDIRTFRGQLAELALEWPGWRNAGWKLESVQPAGNVVTSLSTDDTSDSGRINVGINDKAPPSFELRLSARCPTPKGSDMKIVLPRLLGPSTATARVAFLHAENVDADLIPTGETALRPVSDDGGVSSEQLGFIAGLPVQQFRLETEERQVSVSVTPQPLRVRVQSQTQLELQGRQLAIRQSLKHQVQYERLTDFQIQVPESIARSVRFTYQGLELLPTWSAIERSRDRLARISLPQPTLGQVDLEASWEQALPEELWTDRDTQISIPLLTSQMGTLTANVLEAARPAWFQIAAIDNDWQLEHQDDGLSRWSAEPAVKSFNGLLSPTSGAGGEQFLATRAAVRLTADREGLQTYHVQVRLIGSGPHLNVQLPADAIPTRFAWDGLSVPESELLEFPEGSRRYTLPWPDAGSSTAERLLTLEYRREGRPVSGISPVVETHMPRIPQCRWATRTLWTVTLPSDQHLFRAADGLSPLYRWTRTGLLWHRVPVMSDADVQSWLAADSAAPSSLSERNRLSHRYLFSQVGPLNDLKIRLLSSATTFLSGAGLALMIGFVIIKLPVLRSVLATLCLLCVGIVAALWFLPQFEVLLQPMLIGAGLAGLLGLQEYWAWRRAAGTILTLSTHPSELKSPGVDGSAATHSLIVRGDSATIFREPKSDETRTRSAVESHAG